MHIIWKYVYIDEPGVLGVQYMYVCMMYACIMYYVVCMYVYIDAPRALGVLYMYVCMMYACTFVLCMYVCMYVRNSALYSARRSLFDALIGALVGIDVSKVEYTCVADIRGISINNSSVTFRPFINIAGDYHSSPCIHVPNSSQSPDSGFRLRVLSTSLIHTNKQSNIFPVLLQHKYTLQFTNNSFHFNADPPCIIPPAIHTANHTANTPRFTPLTKSYLSLQNLLLKSPTIYPTPETSRSNRHVMSSSETNQRAPRNTPCLRMSRRLTWLHSNLDIKVSHYTS